MSSQHLYTLADQLGAFDADIDLDLKSTHEIVEKHGDKELFTYSALNSPNFSEAGTPPIESSSRWTIGWVTPSAILSCFLSAVTLAIAHLGLFRWLNGREDYGPPFDQPFVTGLSYFFVNGFRLLLAASLGISFVQMVWKLLRSRPIQLGDLDHLLSVLSNPLQLGRVSLFWKAPIPFLCAIVFWCLPIAMVFPPGALTIETRTISTVSENTVSTLNPTFGYGTYDGMLAAALWQTDNLGAYGGPTTIVRRIATQSILSGSYLTSHSPCGQNCSYTIDVNAPTFQCNESSVSSDLFSWVNSTYPQFDAFEYIYVAHANSAALVQPPYNFNFQLAWSNGGMSGTFQNLSCTTYEAVYTFHIDYKEGLETVTTTNMQLGPILDSSNLYTDFGMFPQNEGNATDNPVVNATSLGSGGGNVTDTNRRANMAAIQDTVVDALSGYIDALILHAQQSANTLIALTDLYSGTTTSPTFNITEESMQHLLQNIVISMLTLNQSNTLANVTVSENVNVFSFSNPARLIVPYFLSACISLAFIISGGHALLSNGISASTGGVFQTLCTTRGSDRLGDLAAKGCLGGRENVPEDLKNLKVMFGVFKNSDHSSSTKPMAGLGTVDEVIPLVKGAF